VSYEAVVFDMDGVLLTGKGTESSLYDRATEQVLAAYGIDDAPADLHSPGGIENFRRACAAVDLPAEEVWARRERAVSDLEHERIVAGDRTLFEDAGTLADLGVPRGVVSNNRQATVDFVVDRFDLPVEAPYGRAPTLAGYRRRKPDAHYLHRALDDLGVAPERALYVGDRYSDVETAANAGTHAALLARDGDTGGDGPEPTHRVADLHDVVSLV